MGLVLGRIVILAVGLLGVLGVSLWHNPAINPLFQMQFSSGLLSHTYACQGDICSGLPTGISRSEFNPLARGTSTTFSGSIARLGFSNRGGAWPFARLGLNDDYVLSGEVQPNKLLGTDGSFIDRFREPVPVTNPLRLNQTIVVDGAVAVRERLIFRFGGVILLQIKGDTVTAGFQADRCARFIFGDAACNEREANDFNGVLGLINTYDKVSGEVNVVVTLPVTYISTNQDFFFFRAAWIAVSGCQKFSSAGEATGSVFKNNGVADATPCSSHAIIPIAETTIVSLDYQDLEDYTLDQLVNIDRDVAPSTATLKFKIDKMGPEYHAVPEKPNPRIVWDAGIQLVIPVVYDFVSVINPDFVVTVTDENRECDLNGDGQVTQAELQTCNIEKEQDTIVNATETVGNIGVSVKGCFLFCYRLGGATVTLVQSGTRQITDSSGSTVFTGLVAGSYSVKIEKSGFFISYETVEFTGRSETGKLNTYTVETQGTPSLSGILLLAGIVLVSVIAVPLGRRGR